jgi:hypothetical protein
MMDLDMRNLHRMQRPLAIRAHARNFLHQFDGSVIALTEDGVAAIQAGVWNLSDEKLRAIRIRPRIGVG